MAANIIQQFLTLKVQSESDLMPHPALSSLITFQFSLVFSLSDIFGQCMNSFHVFTLIR